METIANMEKEYGARYQKYRAANPRLAGDAPLPETFREVMAGDRVGQGAAKAPAAAKKRVKKMRIG
jgi:hypothetical protein